MPKMPRRSRNKAQKLTAVLCLGFVAASSGWGAFNGTDTNATYDGSWSYVGTSNSQTGNPATNQDNTFNSGANAGDPALSVINGAFAALYGDNGVNHTNTIMGGLVVSGDDGAGNSSYIALGSGVSSPSGSSVSLVPGGGDMNNYTHST